MGIVPERRQEGRVRLALTADGPDAAAAGEPQQVTVVFREPYVRPGTPEAEAAGCLCRFREQHGGGIPVPDTGNEDEVIVVSHKDCPLHEIINKPMDDALGDL